MTFTLQKELFLPPALKWAGGKRWLLPNFTQIWKPYSNRRLVEPFAGGLAIALGLQPDRALLNDANPHLINFWTQLQKGLLVEIDMRNDKELYYRHRDRFNELIAQANSRSREAAELFYYLNRTGYNGLCRFNSSGFFNVPFGRYSKITYTSDFRAYIEVLKDWEFMAGDFERLEIDPDDFIYADPPYDTPFTTYSAGGFDWKDQVRLANWLALHPGPVVVSNQATERILELYKGLDFDIQIVDAPRMISCTGDRTKAQEMLATRGVECRRETLLQAQF